MANPLFNVLSGGMPAMSGPMGQPMGQFGQMMQQFQQFKANFQGDPKAEVQKLLQSGKTACGISGSPERNAQGLHERSAGLLQSAPRARIPGSRTLPVR